MRRISGIGLAVVLALAVGCGKKDSTTSPGGGGGGGGGGTSIDGTYLMIGMEMGGKATPEDEIAKEPEAERTIKFAGDKMTATKRDGKEESATIKLDSTKTPPEIDIIDKKGDKTETLYGIYKLEGDKLTICMAESDKPADRPKEFKTAPKDMRLLMILKKK